MLDRDDPVTGKVTDHPWASKPTTVRALAMSFLAQGALSSPKSLSVYVKDMSKELKEFLESDRQDLQDHSVIYLLFTTEVLTTDRSKQDLVDAGILRALVRLLQSQNFDLRQSVACVCYTLYSNSVLRQQTFFELNGHSAMVSLLEKDFSVLRNNVCEVLIYLEDLMSYEQDNREVDLPDNIARLRATHLETVLAQVRHQVTDEDTLALLQRLADKLQTASSLL
jgi:hypothetical protein